MTDPSAPDVEARVRVLERSLEQLVGVVEGLAAMLERLFPAEPPAKP